MMFATINWKFDELDECHTFAADQDLYLTVLRGLFDQAPSTVAALVELHASILRHAEHDLDPDGYLAAVAVLFGLVRAVRQARREIPGEVVLTTVAYLVQAARLRRYRLDYSGHLELARSWLAHAFLVGDVEGGDPR
ncbi:hypothetical protein [Amycolatopsis sp. FDAARGOS 1241]|uniref:hypothetical protein n=1 Tax=Amycolatopsis sp. FDAARGOS 1241 TaxID=2778070 RepID=UPI0019524DDC|nr:hypothetical protein [Amycolatopsis sp. FDAARGOS 1241]QRP45779.1 hypothetical protein I6J71_42980 [Amycolatopsis sp. FDAARGOS 1241]